MSQFADALARLRTVAELLPEDDPDRAEMLSVEGDFTNLMEWALRKRNDFIAKADSCFELATVYNNRGDSFTARAQSLRDVVQLIMESAGEKKYQGVAATVSVKAIPPKPIITDETLIPEAFFKTERSLSKSAVNDAIKAGEAIPGVTMDNGGITLSIRTK